MSSKEISLRMKFRKMSNEELEAVLSNEKASELEKKLAQEFLEKNCAEGGTPVAPVEEAKKKPAPKKTSQNKKEVESTEELSPEKEDVSEVDNPESRPHPMLTDEEERLLSEAEGEFAERQANRKTPSKTDRGMKEQVMRGFIRSESKRESLDESVEVPGLKVGTEVILKEGEEGDAEPRVGVVTRVYRSGDGKEKCMVKFGDEKPLKKRVTAVTIVQK